MANERLKSTARSRGVYLWELAGAFGVTDSWFSRMLRKEFTPEEERRAMDYIDQIAEEKKSKVSAS